jgi:NAD(P)-dependent dehydrogenase (short-subunit alcohol dehydrogenase family)
MFPMNQPQLSGESPTRPSEAKPSDITFSAPVRFSGKVVIVTGVSDRGIGGAIVDRLADEAAAVIVASRSEPQRLMKRLKRRSQPTLFVECDVTRDEQVRRTVDACMGEFGQIDVLINNAGVELAKPLEKMSDDEWRGLLDINLNGAIAMSRAALPYLTEPGGVIVNVASALALGGCPGFVVYSASKAGLIGFTQSLAWELSPRKIRVVAVAPGLVDTPMTHKHIEHLTPDAWKQIQACHPLGVGSPHDVASAVAFLASSDARWITGVTLPLGWAQAYPLPTGPFLSL